MMSRSRWLLALLMRKLWLRASMMAFIGVAAAFAGIVFAPYVPDSWTVKVGAQAIDSILHVLASSMLAVTVFSMSTMVSAYAAATNNVTPRATRLLMEDNTSQNVLATFIGSFLFSLVGIIALSTGLYGSQGRVILLAATIGLIALIAVTILRWVDYLARFGRLEETIQRVETATWCSMKARRKYPYFKAQQFLGELPRESWAVFADAVGYVRHVDIGALDDAAKTAGHEIFVTALPGVFADPSRPIAMVHGPRSLEITEATKGAFSIGTERTFDQDPRFGFCVLAEIASRALSPAINDPGTAIDVIGRAVRLLVRFSSFQESEIDIVAKYSSVRVPPIDINEIFDDVFAPIARDGASMLEIQLRLQRAFVALVATESTRFAVAAKRHSALARQRAEATMTLEHERQAVRHAATLVANH